MASEELLVRMKMDARQYNSQARQAATNTAAVGASAKTAGQATGGLGAKMRGLATGPGGFLAVAGGAFAVKKAFDGTVGAFLSFDDAMTQSLAIMGDVSETMRGELSDAAREVGKTTTFSANEAADAYFFLASAGLDAAASVEAMPQVAQFAQAGMFDLATATDLATDAQSALGLAVDDPTKNLENLTRVTDVFVKANTLANTSVEQISEAMTTKAGAALRSLGKDIEEGSAVLAAFADQGVKGAEAGTQFSIVLRDLQTKALANKQAFAEAGVAVFDAAGEMRNIADIIGDLEGALEGMSDAEQKSTLLGLGFSDKSVSAITTLLGTSDAIREYEEALNDAGGTTQEVADKQLESLSKQFELVLGNIADIGIEIGEELVPAIKLAVEGLGLVAEGLQVFTADTDVERLSIQIGGAADNAAGLATHMLELNSFVPTAFRTIGDNLREFIDEAGLAPREIQKVLDNMDFLTETMGLGGQEARLFAEILREELTNNLTEAEIAARDAVGAYLEHKEATEEAAEGLNDAEQAVRDFFNASDPLGGHLKDQGGKWDDVVTSMEEYETMLRRLTDPVFKALDDQRNLDEALEDYLETASDPDASVADLEQSIFDLIDAEIIARGSTADLDEDLDIAGTTMGIVAEQAGVLEEHLGLVDDAIGRLDGRRIDIEMAVRRTGAPIDPNTIIGAETGFTGPARHSGGPVRAGTPYRIRPDEEIFIPSGDGEMRLNDEVINALKGLSGGSTSTTTNHFPITIQHTDTNTDAQLVSSITSVLRRMETL